MISSNYAQKACADGGIILRVNGEEIKLSASVSLSDFLKQHKFDAGRIAVERNMEIVPKAEYADTILSNSDVLEIVHFVGGG